MSKSHHPDSLRDRDFLDDGRRPRSSASRPYRPTCYPRARSAERLMSLIITDPSHRRAGLRRLLQRNLPDRAYYQHLRLRRAFPPLLGVGVERVRLLHRGVLK